VGKTSPGGSDAGRVRSRLLLSSVELPRRGPSSCGPVDDPDRASQRPGWRACSACLTTPRSVPVSVLRTRVLGDAGRFSIHSLEGIVRAPPPARLGVGLVKVFVHGRGRVSSAVPWVPPVGAPAVTRSLGSSVTALLPRKAAANWEQLRAATLVSGDLNDENGADPAAGDGR